MKNLLISLGVMAVVGCSSAPKKLTLEEQVAYNTRATEILITSQKNATNSTKNNTQRLINVTNRSYKNEQEIRNLQQDLLKLMETLSE